MRRQNLANSKRHTEPTAPPLPLQCGAATARRRRQVIRFSLRDALFAVALIPLLAATGVAQTHYPGMAPEPSTASKLTSSVKSGFSKMSKALIPHTSTGKAPDPISLSVPAEPSAEFHVAVARMAEQAGDVAKAEHHYRLALELTPKHADALIGYAHMLDRQHKLAQATELYQILIKANPGSATAHNDLGICYARQGKLNEAIESIKRAVQIRPNQARYRNNIATILVQSKRLDEAFVHLSATHPKAVAYYNLGYLLHEAGDKKGAARLFQESLSMDSSFAPARVWLEKLRSGGVGVESAKPPQAVARRLTTGPASAIQPAGPAAPMPPAGAASTQRTAVPSQTPRSHVAPLPSIKPLPPIHGNY